LNHESVSKYFNCNLIFIFTDFANYAYTKFALKWNKHHLLNELTAFSLSNSLFMIYFYAVDVYSILQIRHNAYVESAMVSFKFMVVG